MQSGPTAPAGPPAATASCASRTAAPSVASPDRDGAGRISLA